MTGASLESGDNWLPSLAARISEEHHAVGDAACRGLAHAMTAGDLLLEAKAAVPHGQWGPWLREHCSVPGRTVQLYMRLARNRALVEAESVAVAGLTIRGAAALLAVRQPSFRDLIDDVEETIADIRRAEDVTREWSERLGELSAALSLHRMWEAASAELGGALKGLDRAVDLAAGPDEMKLVAMFAEIGAAAAGQIRDHGRRATKTIEDHGRGARS